MKNFIDVLKRVSLFNDIEENDLLRMLSCLGARVEFFDKKYTIFAEGGSTKNIGILLSGSVQLIRNDYYGNRSLLAEVAPAELFAESFACAELDEMPISAVANEPSHVMLIEGSHILHTCNNGCGFHHRLIFNLMRELATKNIMFHQKIEITSKRTTREKLLTYLDIQAKKAGKSSFEIPFDRQELADYLEVERSGLSAEISKLKREGVIDADKNKFTVL